MMDPKNCEGCPKFAVYLEYKSRLSVAQIVVSLSRKSRLNSNFIIRKNGLSLDHASENQKTDIVFKGLRLFPPSCHGMQWVQDGELQMRLQARKYISGEKGLNRERVLSGDFSEEREVPIVNGVSHPQGAEKAPIEKNVETRIDCCSCRQSLICGQSFDRVLPLPSDNWQELTDSWFCCQHSQSEAVLKRRPLVPRCGDFLYSDVSFVVSKSVLHPAGVSTTSGGMVQCARCCNVLGWKTRSENGTSPDEVAISLYKYQVRIHQGEPLYQLHTKNMWLDNLELGIAALLLKYAQIHNCFRFVLEVRDGAKSIYPYMLLWLMDPSNIIYQGTIVVGQVEPQVLEPKSVAKVIYKDCFDDKTQAEEWRKDLGAHCVELPETQCDELLQLLMARTEILPDSLRTANNFMVSYLETGKECVL